MCPLCDPKNICRVHTMIKGDGKQLICSGKEHTEKKIARKNK
jgi:hypothetical protein